MAAMQKPLGCELQLFSVVSCYTDRNAVKRNIPMQRPQVAYSGVS
jgi:hypothetical protein